MKKLINFCFMIFASASFLFAADFSAQVVSVSGKAEFLSGGEWKPLAAGASLKNGDSVQTGFKSSLVLKIKDSTVNVAPLTRMTVEQLAENPEKDSVKLFVNAGGVSSSVRKTSGKKVGFTVRTPVATASVRGTEFSVDNTFDSSRINTMNGSVAVWNIPGDASGGDYESFENAPQGAVFVAEGQGTAVSSGGNIMSQRNLAAADFSVGGGTSTLSETMRQDNDLSSGSMSSSLVENGSGNPFTNLKVNVVTK